MAPRKTSKGNKRVGRKTKQRKEYLKEVEIVPTVGVNLNTPYIYTKQGITGARAQQLAKVFGEYRIKKIIYTLRPLFDTYSSSLPGAGNAPNSVPTIYWRINRYGDVPAAFNGDYMRSMGAKPHRLDDKQVVWSYTPNIIMQQQNTLNTTTATIKMAPWLSTDDLVADLNFNLSTATHYGNTLFVEGGGAGTANGPVALLDVKCIYEFRNPRLVATPQAVDPFTGAQVVVPEVVSMKL